MWRYGPHSCIMHDISLGNLTTSVDGGSNEISRPSTFQILVISMYLHLLSYAALASAPTDPCVVLSVYSCPQVFSLS